MKFTDFQTASFFENPYPVYASLRAEGSLVPIAPNMVMTGHYDIVDALLHDRRIGKAYLESIRARYGEAGPRLPVFQTLSRMMFSINPPAHTPLRSLMMRAFNARQVETIREIARTTAHELIDAMTKADGADLMTSYALPLPVRIICRMLDVPVEDAGALADDTRELTRALDAVPVPFDELAGPNEACAKLERYFADVIEARRKKPGDDLISLLLRIEENGAKMSEADIIANVMLLFGAGHETTSNLLGNALIALHRHPEQLHALRRHPDRIAQAIFECARYDTSVQSTVRTALEDVEIGGTTIPRGTVIMLMLGSANRDPAKFDAPDRLDIARHDARLISFGAGIHHCLGYRLALLELETSLTVLLERLPRLHLTALDDLQWRHRGNLRGVKALAAQW
ncbi:cytochrome [Paraburkholderia sp. SOS3]|nr:cytochrome P450 [Paraburkholderia sp. SOS3]APR39249.1 cytochrome [Paraburkholderia sp. SOS3]